MHKLVSLTVFLCIVVAAAAMSGQFTGGEWYRILIKPPWNPSAILELSDRAAVYFDARTMAKENNKGMRLPMDVWYGQYWGRVQGNNKERRHGHHNQIPEVYLERIIEACSTRIRIDNTFSSQRFGLKVGSKCMKNGPPGKCTIWQS